MHILITGAQGFMGRNLTAALASTPQTESYKLFKADVDTSLHALSAAAKEADFVFHLAGVNRPTDEADFQRGNADFTKWLMKALEAGKKPPVLLSSSTQATLPNPYGQSKLAAENTVFAYGKKNNTPVYIYRLTNAFGKWCRPNYNSAVATFCHNIARDLPIHVNDPTAELHLNYIDDIIEEFLRALMAAPTREGSLCIVQPEHVITLGQLVALLKHFHESRNRFDLVDQSDPFTRKLHATYLSFLPQNNFALHPIVHNDSRGSFTELLHMNGYGQMSVNVSLPHITKGEHWHHTKHEKFIVVSGNGIIRFRLVGDTKILTYPVSGDQATVVDIPPGYTHNIENLGEIPMVTLMWANERFQPTYPDTISLPVETERSNVL